MEPKRNNIVPPPEFSGEGQLVLYTRYGDPREAGWENKWINLWHVQEQFKWFPGEYIKLHKHLRPLLEAAFLELQNLNLHNEIRSCDCCFDIRNIKGSEAVLSTHSWGAAIDLNAADNPFGSLGKWSEKFITTMEHNKLFCGQSWPGRKDPMHFSMVNG